MPHSIDRDYAERAIPQYERAIEQAGGEPIRIPLDQPPAEVLKMIGTAVPDLSWSIKDILVSGDQIVVRGEATGTPERELFGAKPTGRSFKTMSIDVFTVRDSKLASAYHVENWVGALEQLGR